jgi:uncharacterized ferritin-like protein (DUF455 family)
VSDTAERWAREFLGTTDLASKLAPPPPPARLEPPDRSPERIPRPGRPAALMPLLPGKKRKTRALGGPGRRAALLHAFLHHELQAAELFAWALLAFPDTPEAFRRGLMRLCQDELRHVALYRGQIERLGFQVGSFPINDWFWERVPWAPTPVHFLAGLGLGFEAGNLDHGLRFSERFQQAGDPEAAAVQERIVTEEVPHVAFALRWFDALGGAPLEFERWRAHLPPPLSPMMMRGETMNLPARRRAGMPEAFLAELERWSPSGLRAGEPSSFGS